MKKFFVAVAFGRAIRYSAVAYLGSVYGGVVFHWMYRYYQPILYSLLALLVAGALAGLYYWRRFKQRQEDRPKTSGPVQKAA